jgi:hypothetical protein
VYHVHSADVAMNLVINGTTLPVAQLGPDFLLLDGGIDYPPGDATLILRVDSSERRWKVRLPNGISANLQRVAIESIPES